MSTTKNLLSFILIWCITSTVFSQIKINGTITDLKGKAIDGAEVIIENTDHFYYTESDGKYHLNIQEPGKYTIKVLAFGFKNLSKEININPNEDNDFDFTLEYPSKKSITNLKEIIATAKANKSDEVSLINLQQKQVEIAENIGANQLSKQAVGDVGNAVTKATSTVKQQGTSTFSVRGLLDRYNTTTLNGLPIPSNNPEHKNIDLSLFKTNIVEYIGINKVFSPNLSGDFGGANIDIISKEFNGKPYLNVALGSSINTQTIQEKDFYVTKKHQFLGFNTIAVPSNSLDKYQADDWDFTKLKQPLINFSINLDGGRNFMINGNKLKAFFYVGFDNDYQYNNGIEGNYNAQGNKLSLFQTKKYKYNTNTTGLVNLFYRTGGNKLKFTTNYIHSGEEEVKLYKGYHYDWAKDNKGYIRRGLLKYTDLFINQLEGTHKLNQRLKFNWIVGYNMMTSKRPDRITNVLVFNTQNQKYKLRRDGGSSNRYFDNLSDNDFSAHLVFKYKFNPDFKINVGYQGKFKKRHFWSKQYDFRYSDVFADYNIVEDITYIEGSLNKEKFEEGYFNIRSNFSLNSNELTPMNFDGTQNINAGFISSDYKFNPNLVANLGLKAEYIQQNISWLTNLIMPDNVTNTNTTYTKFLPSFNLKYSINSEQNLKLALSRTYTMPQLKELAYYIYDDISEQSQGNPFLTPSDNNNVDIKWEYFPKKGELISLGVYGKYIENPISKALVSESLYSYLNIGDHAYVYGVEAEIRKDIYKNNRYKIYTFANGSYLKSKSTLDNNKIKTNSPFSVSFNKTEEALEGAANFVGNANVGLNYKLGKKTTLDFVIAYSHIGKNLYSIGTQGLGRVVTQPLNLLDSTLKLKYQRFSIGFKAKNILNTSIKRVQEGIKSPTIYEYKNGTELGISLSYKF